MPMRAEEEGVDAEEEEVVAVQHQNHVTGEANGSVMVGMIVCCVLPALSHQSGSFPFLPE